MVLLLVSWLIIYFLASVLGYGIANVSWGEKTNVPTQTELVLAGLALVVAVLQMASIVIPADYRVVGSLIVLAGFINWQSKNLPLQRAVDSLRQLMRVPLFWLLLGVVLLFCVRLPANSDSGLYHVPAIRWYERFKAVPGLGNLHGRLAFNSSFFVASAAFGFTDLTGQTIFALNGFLFLLFGAYVLRWKPHPQAIYGLGTLQILILGLALYFTLFQLSSPTPDVWATILPLFLFLFWLNGVPDARQFQFYLFAALCMACLTVKLGTLPVLLFLPFLFLLHRRSIGLRQWSVLAGIGTLIVGPWLVRNVLLSGYLLYPFPALDLFSVDWKIPMPAVRYEQDYVTFWARFHLFESHMDPAKLTWSPTQWFPIWWRDQGNPVTYAYYPLHRPLFVIAALSPLVMLVYGLRSGLRPFRLWSAYAVALAGFLFWFFKAPEFRFGYAFICTTALLPILPLLARSTLGLTNRSVFWPIGVLLVVLTGRMLYRGNQFTAQATLMPLRYGYHEREADGSSYKAHRTQSGLVLIVPEPAPVEQRCYEIEQPCSPYFFEDLELRGSTIQSGFRRRPVSPELSSFKRSYKNEIQRYYPRLQ